MFPNIPIYIIFLIAMVAAFLVSQYAVKKIIFITQKRKIYDIPDNIRKIHGEHIPSLGGIGIFIGFMATAPFFLNDTFKGWNYLVIAASILFFTGIYDDIMDMRPSKKLLAQLVASAIAIYFADLRIISLHGLLGVEELPYGLSVGLTVFLCTFFINVFNFIDGIDGLACMISILYAAIIGGLLYSIGAPSIASIAFCLVGATAGLLHYNYSPAKIYMGDTGSMLNGFCIWIFILMLVNSNTDSHPAQFAIVHNARGAMVLAISVAFFPVFDALRVFTERIAHKASPLKADRRHLHYYLLDGGFSHALAAWIIIGVNILTILVAWLVQDWSFWLVLPAIAMPTILLTFFVSWRRKSTIGHVV